MSTVKNLRKERINMKQNIKYSFSWLLKNVYELKIDKATISHSGASAPSPCLFFFFFSSPFLIPQNMGPLDFSVKWHMAAIKSPVFRGSILSTCFLLSRGFWSYLPAVLDLLPLLIFSPFSLCSLLVALGIQHTHFNHNIQHQSRTFSLGHLIFPSSFFFFF